MNKFKKMIALVLSIIMIISVVPLNISAAETPTGATLSSKTKYVIPGDKEVVIAIELDNNPGIAGMGITLEYDNSVMSLVDAENGKVFTDRELQKNLTNGSSFAWFGATNSYNNGTLITFKFNISENAEYGSYPIKITYLKENVINSNRDPVDLTIKTQDVVILSYRPGDANGDGLVAIGDAVDICKAFVGYDITINELAADVDSDGRVTISDAVAICQSFIPSYGVVLRPGFEECEHNMTAFESVEATCTESGNIAYWQCTKCNTYFSDEQGNNVISLDETVVDAPGHSLTAIAAKPATNYASGNIAYWHCESCDKYFADKNAQNEITLQDTILNPLGHEIIAFEAVIPTCTEDGSIAYWYCETCNKYYSDATCETEITLADTVVKTSGHPLAAEWTFDEQYHWHNVLCDHIFTGEATITKQTHSMDGTKCLVCPYDSSLVYQLSTPKKPIISYDSVYWEKVPNASGYVVYINDIYTITVESGERTNYEISAAKLNGNGDAILTPGDVRANVKAIGSGLYTDSVLSAVSDYYYYVPESKDEIIDEMKNYGVGKGYNLITDEYLNSTKTKANVINAAKAHTLFGDSQVNIATGSLNSYHYSNIDEFIQNSQSTAGIDSNINLYGTLKFEFDLDASSQSNLRDYNSVETLVYKAGKEINSYKFDDLDESKFYMLENCLTDSFKQDVLCESPNTIDFKNDPVAHANYLYNTYGTHVILGVTTGGYLYVECRVATNDEKVAQQAKVAMKASVDLNGLEKLFGSGLGIGADFSEDLKIESNNKTTTASITAKYMGGSNGLVSGNITDVSNAVKSWDGSFDGTNTRTVGFTQSGEISLSELLTYIEDVSPAVISEFNKKVLAENNNAYNYFFNEYTKEPTLPIDYDENITDKNVLVIDLSACQKSGTLEHVYSPYITQNVLTINPIMRGRSVDSIRIIGDFDDSSYRLLIDNLSIKLSNSWRRDVDITLENVGVVSNISNGLIDLSEWPGRYDANINYVGTNVIQNTSGDYEIYANTNNGVYMYKIVLEENQNIDFSTYGIVDDILYLPLVNSSHKDFYYWIDANDTQITDSDGYGQIIASPEANMVTITPKMGPTMYKITLDSNNATQTGTEFIYLAYNAGHYANKNLNEPSIDTITIPTRTGYDFNGYYMLDENGETTTQYIDHTGDICNKTQLIDSNNVILKAIWTPSIVEIAIDDCGATTPGMNKYYVRYKDGTYSDSACANSITALTPPQKDGLTFGGYWSHVENNGTADVKGDIQITDFRGNLTENAKTYIGTTVYALWEVGKNEKVLFDAQGGTVDVIEKSIILTNNYGELPVAQRAGYTHIGWYTQPNGGGELITKDTVVTNPESHTLYALWESNTYTITYNYYANQSTSNLYPADIRNTNATSVYYANGLSKFTDASRSKYDTFLGWYADDKFTDKIDDAWYAEWAEDPRNVTIYAKWDLAYYYNTMNVPKIYANQNTSGLRTKAVIDWSGISSGDYYKAIDADGNNNRDNGQGNLNLDIVHPITDVYFIGKPGATYSNVHLVPCVYGSSVSNIHLENFNFKGTIWGYSHDGSKFDVTLYLTGSNSLQGTIYQIDDLTFKGSGTFIVHAPDGANATSAGGNGSNGAVAVTANTVTANLTGTVTLYGGDGGNGRSGSGVGKSGGNGGNGGAAFVGDLLSVSTSNSIKLIGGDGGNGGIGTTGYNGIATDRKEGSVNFGGVGGQGGNGGNGGTPISGNAKTKNAVFTYGDGGDGGVGGNGGEGGHYHNEFGSVWRCSGGNGGRGGNGGNGSKPGSYGTGGSAGSYDDADKNTIWGGIFYDSPVAGQTDSIKHNPTNGNHGKPGVVLVFN